MMAATAMTGGTGSALYMAPEVFLNEAYDERCDVFSFGMVFYEVLRGTLGLAFLDYGADGLENATVTYAKRVASGWRPEIPAEWPSEVKVRRWARGKGGDGERQGRGKEKGRWRTAPCGNGPPRAGCCRSLFPRCFSKTARHARPSRRLCQKWLTC